MFYLFLPFQKNFQLLKEEFRKMSPPPGLEGVPLSPALASARSPAASNYREALGADKERDASQGGKEKEPWGAAGVQAGGPVRNRIRKTSRANLFAGKHGPHGAGIRVSSSTSIPQEPATTLPGKVPQPGPISQDPTPGTSATPAQGEPHPVTTVPETPTSACSTQDGLPSEAQEVFNHVNHNSSSVEDGAVTPAGTPC